MVVADQDASGVTRSPVTAPATGVVGLGIGGLVVVATEGGSGTETRSSAASSPCPSGWSPPPSARSTRRGACSPADRRAAGAANSKLCSVDSQASLSAQHVGVVVDSPLTHRSTPNSRHS